MKKLKADRRAWLALKWSQIKAKASSVWSGMDADQRIIVHIALLVATTVLAALTMIRS